MTLSSMGFVLRAGCAFACLELEKCRADHSRKPQKRYFRAENQIPALFRPPELPDPFRIRAKNGFLTASTTLFESDWHQMRSVTEVRSSISHEPEITLVPPQGVNIPLPAGRAGRTERFSRPPFRKSRVVSKISFPTEYSPTATTMWVKVALGFFFWREAGLLSRAQARFMEVCRRLSFGALRRHSYC